MSSTVIAKNIQIGTSGTATNNFNWYQPAAPDGTVRLGVGNYGATTLDAVTVTNAGNVGIGTTSPRDVAGYVSLGLNDTTGSLLDFYANGTRIGGVIGVSGNMQVGTATAIPLIFNTDTNERARIDSSGNAMWNGTNTTTQNGNVGYVYKFFGGNNNLVMPMEVGIGDRYAILEFRQTGRTNSARASQISIGQNSLNQGDVQIYSSGANADVSGGVRLANGATSWSAISDMRLKTVTGTYTNALQDIAKIQAIKFTWKHDQSGTPQVGVSAQSVQLVVPEAVSTSRNIATPDDETEYLSVRYTELIPLMIASIQEQQALIESLTARIAALEAK